MHIDNNIKTSTKKNMEKILMYYLLISVLTLGCSRIEKKNDPEASSTEISNDKGTSLEESEPESFTFKMKLWQEGIDFYARGNEPSWALDIDLDAGIKFSNMDGILLETTSLDIQKAADAKVTRFSGSGESGEILVTVTEEECNDTMADEKFHNSVIVEINTEEVENETFSGCGQYVPDYRLHDIWVLIEVNGQEVEDDLLNEKGRPTFEFFVEEGRISGHAGCNNMNGSFYRAGEDILHFQPLVMTRMMCPEMKLEDLIAQSLADKRIKYEVNDLKLSLKGYDDTELILKKID